MSAWRFSIPVYFLECKLEFFHNEKLFKKQREKEKREGELERKASESMEGVRVNKGTEKRTVKDKTDGETCACGGDTLGAPAIPPTSWRLCGTAR